MNGRDVCRTGAIQVARPGDESVSGSGVGAAVTLAGDSVVAARRRRRSVDSRAFADGQGRFLDARCSVEEAAGRAASYSLMPMVTGPPVRSTASSTAEGMRKTRPGAAGHHRRLV